MQLTGEKAVAYRGQLIRHCDLSLCLSLCLSLSVSHSLSLTLCLSLSSSLSSSLSLASATGRNNLEKPATCLDTQFFKNPRVRFLRQRFDYFTPLCYCRSLCLPCLLMNLTTVLNVFEVYLCVLLEERLLKEKEQLHFEFQLR